MSPATIIARCRGIDLGEPDLRLRIGSWEQPALLGGNRRGGPAGRWSILAARPRRTFESATGRSLRWSAGERPGLHQDDALAELEAVLARLHLGGDDRHGLDDDLPFMGGMIGFLAYDLAPCLEAIPRRLVRDSRVPAIRFGLYDTFVLIDHRSDRATLWATDLLGEGEAAIAARLDEWAARLAVPAPIVRPCPPTALGPVVPDRSRDDYLARVERARRYIEAGDVFQVNLAQRFTAAGAVDPLDLDRQLRTLCPAAYSAYLRWDDVAIISASPELFYETRGRQIRTRPIKGTRPRALDPGRDAALLAELIASPKDEAELTMIVDLERNDLGRVCEYGSVRVIEPRAVETHPNVHHTVATVVGTLRAHVGPVDVVRALFPGGSITGAPKIRAMEIIDELEPCRRGLYTGAIGYWSANGRSAFNIAIRTLVVEEARVTYHVGGGIVAESDAAAEYQETLDKGRLLLQALAWPGSEA